MESALHSPRGLPEPRTWPHRRGRQLPPSAGGSADLWLCVFYAAVLLNSVVGRARDFLLTLFEFMLVRVWLRLRLGALAPRQLRPLRVHRAAGLVDVWCAALARQRFPHQRGVALTGYPPMQSCSVCWLDILFSPLACTCLS